MRNRLRTAFVTVSVAITTLVLVASPAGAQQLVDGGKEEQGGLAFVLMAVMFGAIFLVLFSMDRIRKRRLDTDDIEKG
jgi:peptidoglycan biosynthesis protein MviN/MurJ (putative lipid II flippase)